MNQFEAYLRARGIKPETNATKPATVSTGKRRKRSTEKSISETLSDEKVRVGYIQISVLMLLKFQFLTKILSLFYEI